MLKTLSATLWLVSFWACFPASADMAQIKDGYFRPLTIPMPQDAPYSPQVATLGKMLFFDPRLSRDQNISCSSCHNPSFGWEVPVDRALGATSTRVARHAPTIVNSAWVSPFFWDGRAATLEDQAIGPITAADEMNSSLELIVQRLTQVEEYRHWFEQLFPSRGITDDTVLQSIATYERTIVAGWSDFDRWIEGDPEAITTDAVLGFELFNGKAGCARCHSGWNFTDNAFHRIGLPDDDIGRAGIAPDKPGAQYAFKTPGLRNIALRAPYMHDGSLPDLAAVIRHYAQGGTPRAGFPSDLMPFTITDAEIQALIAFLSTLSDENLAVPSPTLPMN